MTAAPAASAAATAIEQVLAASKCRGARSMAGPVSIGTRSGQRDRLPTSSRMPDLITVLVAVVSLVLGWGLKTLADAWTWRREQVLEAYLELLDAADRYSMDVSRLWNEGSETTAETMRTPAWVSKAQEVRGQGIAAVDRAHGKLILVGGSGGARASGELYLACEVMFRRAISLPPSTVDHFQEAAVAFSKTYHDVVEQARREMGLRHWRERVPGRESNFEFMRRRMAELNQTDPLPGAGKPGPAVPPKKQAG